MFCFVLFHLFIYLFYFLFFGRGGGVEFVVELNKFRANKCKQSKGKESDPTSSLSKVLWNATSLTLLSSTIPRKSLIVLLTVPASP